MRAAAAAAAAAGSLLFDGLSFPRDIGLRLRRCSDFLYDGERDRLSNLDFRDSDSVLSKRERFRGSSAIFHVINNRDERVWERKH